MRLYAFRPASNRADWSVNFQVKTDSGAADWDALDDVVTLAMHYDQASGPSDYGRVMQPPAAALSAASNDGSGVVSLLAEGIISILVPASTMGGMPPCEMVVTLAYSRVSDGRKATLWQGRLPLIEGYI